MKKYEYIGCFLDREELFQKAAGIREKPLCNEKQKPHITFVYAPKSVPEELFGQTISIMVMGYGNDGHNEGLRVTLTSNHPTINEMIAQIPVPHITLAVSNDGQAVNTRYLCFSPVKQFSLVGYFGGHLQENTEQEDG
ncbi:MAG: hypothetical protein E7421_05965 [Ruminococcaceae bacterium]|nr:hypothetical protein [Oscillospiraceae bacterium]